MRRRGRSLVKATTSGTLMGGSIGAAYGALIGLFYGSRLGPLAGMLSGGTIGAANGALIGTCVGAGYYLAEILLAGRVKRQAIKVTANILMGAATGTGTAAVLHAWGGSLVGAVTVIFGTVLGACVGGAMALTNGAPLSKNNEKKTTRRSS